MNKTESYLNGATFKCSSLEHFTELSQAFEVSHSGQWVIWTSSGLESASRFPPGSSLI